MVSYFDDSTGFVIGFSQFGRKNEKMPLFEKLQALDFLAMMGVAAGTCNLGYPMAASGQNMGYRHQAYQQAGGYRPIAHRVSGDDVLLMQLVRKMTRWNIAFAFDHGAFGISKAQHTLSGFINQRKRWASNGPYQLKLNVAFFIYLALVWVYNLTILAGIPYALLTTDISGWLWCLAGKCCAELLMATTSAALFQRTDLLVYFPVWFFTQIPYIVIAGFLGLFGRFQWKDRAHNSTCSEKK